MATEDPTLFDPIEQVPAQTACLTHKIALDPTFKQVKYTPAELKQAGVYEIVHLESGKRYVGSTAKSFAHRWGIHRSHLRKGKHHSRHLQRAWDKYGADAFEFRIAEVTRPEHAVAVEQTFLDFRKSYDRRFGYNASPTAGSPLGAKHSDEACKASGERSRARTSTPEARKAMSERMSTPEARKANSERVKAQMSTPEARKAASDRARSQFCTPEVRMAASERIRVRNATPEARKANSEQQKAINANPVRKAARLAKFRATLAAKKIARQLELDTKSLLKYVGLDDTICGD